MGYTRVNELSQVSIGQNMEYSGAIPMRKCNNSDTMYVCIEDKYYKISKDGIEEGNQFRGLLYEFGSNPRIIDGKFIAFKLKIQQRNVLYFTITSKAGKQKPVKPIMPILIYQELQLEDSKVVNFCYNPVKSINNRGYVGTIGTISSDIYNTVINKARLLDRPMPKTDYIKKAIKLKNEIEDSQYIPLSYKQEHEDIILDDVFPQEMNKLYFISKLRYIIEDYSNGLIYYSGCLKEVERKYKLVKQHFKYELITT